MRGPYGVYLLSARGLSLPFLESATFRFAGYSYSLLVLSIYSSLVNKDRFSFVIRKNIRLVHETRYSISSLSISLRDRNKSRQLPFPPRDPPLLAKAWHSAPRRLSIVRGDTPSARNACAMPSPAPALAAGNPYWD